MYSVWNTLIGVPMTRFIPLLQTRTRDGVLWENQTPNICTGNPLSRCLWYRSLEKKTFQCYTGTCIRPPWDSSPLLDLFFFLYWGGGAYWSLSSSPCKVQCTTSKGNRRIDIFPDNVLINVSYWKITLRTKLTHFYDIITVRKSFHFVNNNKVNVWPIFRNRKEFVTIFIYL